VPAETYDLHVADAEHLPFDDDRFDIAYSWGVLHHSPDTQRALAEAYRVLRPGGTLKAMLYHVPSWVGLQLYLLHGLGRGNVSATMREVISDHLESPGTKAYTTEEVRWLLEEIGFSEIHLSTKLGPGDLLTIKPSKKYDSVIYKVMWRIYPRWLVRRIGDQWGLNLLIIATKPAKSI
jgi:SAM-dependent methyltransferase